jgi:hypothetical protein
LPSYFLLKRRYARHEGRMPVITITRLPKNYFFIPTA